MIIHPRYTAKQTGDLAARFKLISDLGYLPHTPFPKQQAFLLNESRELLFGGAMGGGKSDALLMDAVLWVDNPAWHSIIIRRIGKDLKGSDGLIERSRDWFGNRTRWNGTEMKHRFPSGATLSFGHCETVEDRMRYTIIPGSWPVLSANRSTGAPKASSMHM